MQDGRIAPATSAAADADAGVPDRALIARIAAGEKAAMRLLFLRYQTRVYRFALGFVGNKETAEDVISEVFFDAWRQAGRFEGRSQVSTWLLAIARNKALLAMRRRTHAPLDEAAEISDTADDPEVAMRKRNRSEIVRRCLRKLPPHHRQVIDLVYYHEKSPEEAAAIIGIPRATVKSRMFYARKQIAQMLTAENVSGELVAA